MKDILTPLPRGLSEGLLDVLKERAKREIREGESKQDPVQILAQVRAEAVHAAALCLGIVEIIDNNKLTFTNPPPEVKGEWQDIYDS